MRNKKKTALLLVVALLFGLMANCVAQAEATPSENMGLDLYSEFEDLVIESDPVSEDAPAELTINTAPDLSELQEVAAAQMTNSDPEQKAVVITGISVPEIITLGAGETRVLTPKLSPRNATEKIKYATSDKKIVTVNSEGALRAKKVGTARVIVRSEGGVEATVKVTVKKKPGSLKLNKKTGSVEIGKSFKLKPKFPANAGGGITYSSSDPQVAVVSSSGKVTGLARGSATITARTYNGKKAKCTVTVFQDVKKLMTQEAADRLEVLFFDVGWGDCILLHCGGEYALVDIGRRNYGKQVAEKLKKMGIRSLKYFICTHKHGDHVDAAPVILANFSVGKVIVPHKDVVKKVKNMAQTKKEKKAVKNAKYAILSPGNRLTLGGTTLDCIGPLRIIEPVDPLNENSNSLILRVTYGKRTLLLPGDSTTDELKEVRARDDKSLYVDVLKNPHHFQTLKSAYKWFHMQTVVVSTGKDEPPEKDLENRVAALGATLYVTASNRNGEILMINDGNELQFYTTY